MARSNESRFTRNIPVRQLPENRSGIIVIWLENTPELSWDERHTRLKSFSDRCFIVYYSSVRKCMKHLKRPKSREYIIIIIVSHSMETIQRIIHRLQLYRVIQTILVVINDGAQYDHLPLTARNLYIFRTVGSMFENLESRIKEVEERELNGGLFATFCRGEKSLKDVRDDLAAFVWTHVFKVLLMSIPRGSPEAKRQMLRECRAYYRNDPQELAQISEFERQYKPEDAIRWYTKPGFLFYLINKALRSQDIWVLYRFRYVIVDLSILLERLSISRPVSSMRLYRGTKLNQDELQQLRIGCIISTNGFFSCSSVRRVAEMFIGIDSEMPRLHNHSRDAWEQCVLFIIDVDYTKSPHTIVADVSHESFMQDENEMLFNFGSTFIINKIYFDDNKCIWVIEMSASSDNARINEGYEKYIRLRLQHISPIIMLGHILANIGGDVGQWINYFYRLRKLLPLNHLEKPNIYYCLGHIYRFMEKFDKALHCFQCARLLVRRLLPERMFDYCRILDGMATIYSIRGMSERAIRLFEQASVLQRNSFPVNHHEIPFHLNLMGHALYRAQLYDHALRTLTEAEKFFQEKMLDELQGYAQTLHIMGLVYRALNRDDEALSSFEQALGKRYSLLGKDHPHLASTYYQLSLLHYDRGDYDRAFDYIQKALNIQLVKLPRYHSEPRLSIELCSRIKRMQV